MAALGGAAAAAYYYWHFAIIHYQFHRTSTQPWVFHRDVYSDIDTFIKDKKQGVLLVYGPPLSMKSYYLHHLATTRTDTVYM